MSTPENTPLRDIENSDDIALVVNTFYDLVRKDEQLGPIFNKVITDWPSHLHKIILFWDQVLFDTRLYQGNPRIAHIEADRQVDHAIEINHFGVWVFYWVNVINENFVGPRANLLIERARRMQTVLYVNVFKNKPENRDM